MLTIERRAARAARWMLALACACGLGGGLGGCASPPARVAPPDAALWADDSYPPPSEPVDASTLFVPSEAMQAFLRREVLPQARRVGPAHALVDALNDRGRLRLEYDAEFTRDAAQAFDARAGNCLSLAVMTASLAGVLGLQVRFQSAIAAEQWTRVGDLQVASGHVNLRIGAARSPHVAVATGGDLVVDFVPPASIAGLRVREIDRDTVVAMYMNNRAAEALMRGQMGDAYAWARAAITTRPDLVLAINTLGVVHQRHGDLARAERAYAHALAIDPDHAQALANLVALLTQQQRLAEAAPLRERLARLEPVAPWAHADQGLAALRRGDLAQAREQFTLALRRTGPQAELHFWLGLVHWQQGDMAAAQRQLVLAREASTRRDERARYAGKLQALQALQAQSASPVPAGP